MKPVYIKRYHPHRRDYTEWSCGCLLATGFMFLFAFITLYALWPKVASLGMQLSGVNRLGETGRLFQDAPLAHTAVVLNPTSPQQASVHLGQSGGEIVRLDQPTYEFVTGDSESGVPIARASFTEAGLLAICAQQSIICREGSNQFRNVVVDLRPGGAVIYADVHLSGLIWQRSGVVLQLDNTRTLLRVAGVDIDGSLYDYSNLPVEWVGRVDDIARTTNEILRQVMVEAGGESYTLSGIVIDDTTLTAIFY